MSKNTKHNTEEPPHVYHSYEEFEKRFYPADREKELFDLNDPTRAREKLAEVSWENVKSLLCLK